YLDLTASTLAAAARTLPSLDLSGFATFISDDDLTVTGAFDWNQSTLQGVAGVGSLTVVSDMTLNSFNVVRDFNLINAGDAVWSAGTVNFQGNSRFTNLPGAMFDDQIDGTFGGVHPACPIFDNQGTFTKSGAAGVTNLEMQLYNSGTVQINQGILDIHCGY